MLNVDVTHRNSEGWQFDLFARVEGVVHEVLADVVFHVQHRVAVFAGAPFNFNYIYFICINVFFHNFTNLPLSGITVGFKYSEFLGLHVNSQMLLLKFS